MSLLKTARLEAGFAFSSGGIVLMHRPPEETEFKRSANERCVSNDPEGARRVAYATARQ